MTAAQKYLRDLQLSFLNRANDKVTLPEHLQNSQWYDEYVQMHEEASASRITKEQNPAASIILDLLQKETITSLNQRRINFDHIPVPVLGSLRSHLINAQVVKVPDSQQNLIIFEEGLFSFLTLVTNSIVSSFDIDIQKNFLDTFSIAEAQVADLPDQKKRWLDITASFFEAYLLKGNPFAVDHSELSPNKFNDTTVHIINWTIEIFVMGHEWGHLIGGHLDNDQIEMRKIADMEIDVIRQNLNDEMHADLIGVALCADFLQRERFPLLSLTFIHLVFWYMDTMERCINILQTGLDGPLHSSTHPPSRNRHASIEQWVQRSLPSNIIDQYYQVKEGIYAYAKPHLEHTVAKMWQKREQVGPIQIAMH